MREIIVILAALLLSACATSHTVYTPDGRPGYMLNCSGTARNWGECQSKAGELCGSRGYDIVSVNGENVGTVAGGSASANTASFFATPVIKRTMMVACKP